MNAESIIKGRTAGLIVSLMLQESGYSVFRYGYEGAAEALAQVGGLKKAKILELVTSTPHFVVADQKQGATILIGVRFQGDASSGRNIPWGYGKIADYWPDSHLLVVRTDEPYFFIVVEKNDDLKLMPLKKAGLFKLKDEQIKKYGHLARKFLS